MSIPVPTIHITLIIAHRFSIDGMKMYLDQFIHSIFRIKLNKSKFCMRLHNTTGAMTN